MTVWRHNTRVGLTVSAVGHATLLLWGVLTFTAKPHNAESTESMPIDIISAADFSKLTAGASNAPKSDTSKPLVDEAGQRKPVEDATAKIERKEIKAADDKPPPPPEPKPPAAADKKPPEQKRDLIADAIKKEQAKKLEQKKVDAKAPVQPKREPQQPKFDPKKVEALLDKRTPQRLAATGDVINETVNLGSPAGVAAQLSQTELDALRERLAQLWNPPADAANPAELNVVIRIKLNSDGRLAAPPMVMTSANGKGPLFAIARDRAAIAVLRGQPFDMLLPEHYDQWKEVEITFDYAEMRRR